MVNIFSKLGQKFVEMKKLQMEGAKKVGVTKSLLIGAGTLAGVAAAPSLLRMAMSRGAGSVMSSSAVTSSVTAGTKSKPVWSAIKNAYQTALGNPLASGGIKGFASRIFGRTLGGVGLAYGAGFAESAVTGEPVDVSARRLSYGALGFGLGGPFGFVGGTLLGLGKKAVSTAQDYVSNIGAPPTSVNVGSGGLDWSENPLQDFALKQPEIGDMTFAPQYSMGGSSASYGMSPSVNVGAGGGMDFSTLMMLMLGGFGGGYLLGRRKRKKKSKKKKQKK